MKWFAFATFIKHGRETFRTKTELRVGKQADQLLGVVLMINPGSSKGESSGSMVEASTDSTMNVITNLVEEAYRTAGATLPNDGYIRIANLFDLCEPGLQDALSKYRRLRAESPQHPLLHCSVGSIPKDVPWVWLAWGSEHHDPVLAEAMGVMLDQLKAKILGAKIATQTVGYYHPRYMLRMKNLKSGIWNSVVQQIGETLV